MANRASVEDLSRLDVGAATEYGAKAAMLGALARRGHAVPEGFAIAAGELDAFLAGNAFPYCPGDYPACSAEIREWFAGRSPDPKVAATLRERVARLGADRSSDRLIVRTSALCEDGRTASMAGVFESFVVPAESGAVERAVLDCWRSLFADRAIDAWQGRAGAGAQLRAGVVVQRYVDGELSGVTFTADTTEMDPDVVVVSAAPGPCSALTSGSGAATTYVLSKGTGAVVRVTGDPAVLSEPWLARLLRSAKEIEELAGSHQDIEWTIRDGRLWVLQSRPVTGFRERTSPGGWQIDPPGAPDRLWTLRGETCLPPLVAELAAAASVAAGKGAYDRGMPWDSVTAAIRNGYLYEAPRPIPDQKRRIDEYLAHLECVWNGGEDEFHHSIRPELSRLLEAMQERYVGRELGRGELLEYLDESEHYLRRSAELHWQATTSEWYLGHFLRKRVERHYDAIGVQDLVDMVASRTTMVAEREELYELAALVRGSEELRGTFERHRHDGILAARIGRARTAAERELARGLGQYGRRYGWFCGGNLEDGRLCAPGTVPLRECINRVRRYLHVDLAEYHANRAEAAAKGRRLRELGLGRCANEEERRAFGLALAAGEKAYLAGDDHASFICAKKFVHVSDALRRVGAVFAADGTLECAEDVHFLGLAEVRDRLARASSAREVVARRKAEHLARTVLLPPRTIGVKQAAEPMPPGVGRPAASGTATITGQMGTRRDARGKIRIGMPANPPDHDVIVLLEHGHEGDLTTVLGRVKGIMMKFGTPACHTGIIARELGIPAVYGVGNQADGLRDGDEVEIRGQTGEVVVLGRGG